MGGTGHLRRGSSTHPADRKSLLGRHLPTSRSISHLTPYFFTVRSKQEKRKHTSSAGTAGIPTLRVIADSASAAFRPSARTPVRCSRDERLVGLAFAEAHLVNLGEAHASSEDLAGEEGAEQDRGKHFLSSARV